MCVLLYDAAAEEDLRGLRVFDVQRILDDVDAQLTEAPTKRSRRKKVLEGLVPPWDSVRPVWQLRVGDFRVFYDVDDERQQVIVRQSEARARRLRRRSYEGCRSGRSQELAQCIRR